MQKSIGILNFKLPFINKNNNIRKFLKENYKNNTQKINEKSIYKLKNNASINNISRNSYKSKDKRLTMISQEKNNSEKINCNNTSLKSYLNNNKKIFY